LRRWARSGHSVIKDWKSLIDNCNVKLIESDSYPLAIFSQKFAKEISTNGEIDLNSNLKNIEINLGIQPNHYHHLFEVEVIHEKTSNFYDASKIDTLLKGKNAAHIDAFRGLL
jgi:acyl-CoA oxidase